MTLPQTISSGSSQPNIILVWYNSQISVMWIKADHPGEGIMFRLHVQYLGPMALLCCSAAFSTVVHYSTLYMELYVGCTLTTADFFFFGGGVIVGWASSSTDYVHTPLTLWWVGMRRNLRGPQREREIKTRGQPQYHGILNVKRLEINSSTGGGLNFTVCARSV